MFYRKIFLTVFICFIFNNSYGAELKNDSSKLLKILSLEAKERLELNKNDIFPLLEGLSNPEKIAFWAEFFVGVEYDTELIGNYVKEGVIVLDSALDCMSHTFRSFELAFAKTEEKALDNALFFRFPLSGKRSGNKIISYEERFEYGEDMALSGKFGRLISNEIDVTVGTENSRSKLDFLTKDEVQKNLSKLKTGDTIFFVKGEKARKGLEIVGHIGILKLEKGEIFLIHASGKKNKGGEVKKVNFSEYLEKNYPFFTGIILTRN